MKRTLVAVFDDYNAVLDAVEALDNGGIDKELISVVGRGQKSEPNRFEYYKHSQDAAFWGEQGAFWGAIMGFLIGGFLTWFPGVGPVIAAGPLMNALAGIAAGAVVGGSLSALAAVLVDWGVTEAEAQRYEAFVKEGRFLLLVHGDEEAVKKAQTILKDLPHKEMTLH